MPFPYSSITHPAVASAGPFVYGSLSLLTDVPAKDQLKVYLNGQLKVYNVDYTIDLIAEEITMTPAVTGSIKIARETDIENKEVTFTNSSVLTAQDLNKNSDQLLFLAQELYDKAQNIALTPVGSLADNSISSNLLNKNAGTEAVVTTAIFDGAVTTAKIANDAVTVDKIATDAVEEDQIKDGAVTADKIADNNVTVAKLATGAPSWDGSGNVTVSGGLTVTGNIVGGAASIPAVAHTHLTTRPHQSSALAFTTTRATSPAISDLNTTITTKRNNSLVLVTFNISGCATDSQNLILILERSPDGSTWTEIGSPADPGSSRGYGIKTFNYDATATTIENCVISYLDTPGNAGSYTYRVRGYSSGGSINFRLNQTSTFSGANHEAVTSTVILQEVFQ